MKKTYSLFCFLMLTLVQVFAQQNIMTHLTNYESRGDKMFYYFSYKAALDDYLIALKNDPEKNHIKLKIAECYHLLNDPGEAESWYAQAINSTQVKPEHKLHYAQALSSNKKYEEAKKWYAQYQAEVSDDSRSARKIEAINNIDNLFKDSLLYIVSPLSINSPASDFSPAFYGNGIVFVSARNQSKAVKNEFSWNKSHFLDLYYSQENENGTNAAPQLFHKNVNTDLHEGPTVFFDGGKKMIFTRNNLLNRKRGESQDGVVKLKLYYSERTGDEWSKPQSLPFNHDDYSVGHPAISHDGSILYFISDMPGGEGGTDIYKSKWQNGSWGKPENLGPEINTEGNEMFPFLHNDDLLYFASNGHGGLGGLDIFSANLNDKKIINIGYPVNSSLDDFGLILNEEELLGYFTSNRKGSAGDDDIYRFQIKRKLLEIIVVEKETGKVIPDASVRLFQPETTGQTSVTSDRGSVTLAVNPKKIYLMNIQKEQYLPVDTLLDATYLQRTNDGLVKIQLKKPDTDGVVSSTIRDSVSNEERTMEDKEKKETRENTSAPSASNSKISIEEKKSSTLRIYQLSNISGFVQELLSVNNRTYLIDNEESALLNTDGQMVTHWDIELPSRAGERKKAMQQYLTELGYTTEFIEINNIYYDFDKAVIRSDAMIELDKIVQLMNDYPELKITMSSHTDSRGSDGYNNALAIRRVQTAYNYLINNRIEPGRIIMAGYGEKKLVNDCDDNKNCQENAHQLNRRTEFKIFFDK